jgi:predicted nucleic acid-binding protein
MLVVDASAAFVYALADDGFEALRKHDPIAPPLMWSETLSALHETHWRGDEDDDIIRGAIALLVEAPIVRVASRELYVEARRVAMMFGWAKTYDAEYIALTRLHDCRLVSVDARLRRRAGHIVSIIAPADL